MSRFICIHGHFYQPPRENPWLETIEHQESAYPFHDWNERITSECYAPNAWSRMLDADGYITRISSNYAKISFNFGPTLLAWMERARPDVYEGILAADAKSIKRFKGHGSALAQAYNHSILPLCNRRDKITQIRWGLRDFESRFGRRAEGMWLPETAVDTETLELLADEGVAFTLLAPHQAAMVRPPGSKQWMDVRGSRIDPRRAYRAELPSGKSIALFFYDGPVSQAVAFERLLESGDRFANRLLNAFDEGRNDEPQLVHIATDGETYGHHHRHGEMALAYALQRIQADERVELVNYGEFLERFEPRHEVQIVEQTSWSCAHGIERWRSDCGCHSGMHPHWHQRWRAPLRAALDWLSDTLARFYESRAERLFVSPWRARDEYIEVLLDRSPESVDRFLERTAKGPLDEEQRTVALELLEMQRHALLMYTSCGWFFDEVSGIETTQIIFYAARAIQLAQELGDIAVERPFLERLAEAPSNLPEHGNARNLYEKFVAPMKVDLASVVAHYAVSSLFTDYEERTRIFAYQIEQCDYREATLGRSRLAVGKVRISAETTLDSAMLSFGILHLGDHNMSGGVRAFMSDDDYDAMSHEVREAFARADMPELLRLLDRHFGELTYSMRSLFKDEQKRVLDVVVGSAMADAETLSSQLYERHSPLLRYLATLDLDLPKALRGLADFVINTTLRREFERNELDHRRISDLLREAHDLNIDLDRVGTSFGLQRAIERLLEQWSSAPDRLGRLRRLRNIVTLARSLPFEMDLAAVQNGFYHLMETVYPHFADQAERGDPVAAEWCEHFKALGEGLHMRLRSPR